jgi:2-oxoglutarate ferredoxin oxidoreductase subunit beta
MHSIHGRAPAIATGLAVSRPDLSVWVVTGDGDGLSIGTSHLLHALRRNVNIKVLLFNNQIYGLTKGQYSPTSEVGKVTKSTPYGSLDTPFRPVSLVLGAESTFVARSLDTDRKHLTTVLRAAAEHPGAAFIEIYQNCPIFNDGAFDRMTDSESRDAAVLRMEPGEPLVFGDRGIRRSPDGGVEACAADDPGVIRHDPAAADPSLAFALSRLNDPTPIGIFRNVDEPSYDEQARAQIDSARTREGAGDALALQALLNGSDTWTVGA